jgi:RND family efflux transporter MFP subunit
MVATCGPDGDFGRPPGGAPEKNGHRPAEKARPEAKKPAERPKGPPGPPGGRPAPVELVTLETVSIRDTTEYLGTIESRRTVVVQPEVEGRIVRIFVRPGDRVAAGQPLMQIDPEQQEAQVATARANRAARRAELRLAGQRLRRTRRLVAREAVSRQELDEARAAYDAAKAALAAVEAQIEESRVKLGFFRVAAPVAGVVGDVPSRIGDRVTPTTILTTIGNNQALEAEVSVPVERAEALRIGMQVLLADTAGRPIGVGEVFFIAPRVNPETQAVLISSDVPDTGRLLRDEQMVRARLVWRSFRGIKVPPLAVQRLGGQTFVFVAERTGRGLVARQRAVELGALDEDGYIVSAGLQPGERLVSAGTQQLGDGAPIAPAEARR